MELLVRTENNLPLDTAEDVRTESRNGERTRAMEMREAGILKRLWRVPGRNATVGLYEADDPAALHEASTSLTMWKWMDITVDALATHPQER
ncbi:muconolactone Delta-isomerase family protein [Gordonia terrae]